MELPSLGKQCSVETCGQLDFLPIQCSYCGKTFCKECSSLDKHNCPSIRASSESNFRPVTSKNIAPKTPCTFENCDRKVVTACPICVLEFCMEHRLEKDHCCSKVEENHIEDSIPKTQALVESILAKKKDIPKSDPKVVKNQKLAAKVQLMKLKMKAQGSKSVPNQDRIYFGVKSCKSKDIKPVFVSSTWPFGKVLDAIADLVGLENKNNMSNVPKLKLFKKLDGLLITDQFDQTLCDLLKTEVIFNGDTLIMEYVESNDVLQIDSSKY